MNEFFQSHAAQKLQRTRPARPAVGDVHQRQLNILQNREAFDDVIFLKNEGNILLSILLPIALQIVRGRFPADQQFALLVGVHPAEHVEQRGFTRAGFACDRNKLAPVKGQVHPAYAYCHIPLGHVYLSDISQFQQRCRHFYLPSFSYCITSRI